MIWLSLASLYPDIDEFHAEIDFLIENKMQVDAVNSKKQTDARNAYINYKIGDSYYYQPVNMLPDPAIIIGATKISNIVSFIQFGMSLISVLDSKLEKLVVQSLLAVLTGDNTFDFNKIGTEGSYGSPYSLILPQFLMELWNPATSEYFKTEKTEQIEGYLMDFLVMENMAWLHNSPDQTSSWQFPGIYGIGMHGVDIKNEKYWEKKPRKVWTAFKNGLSIINIFPSNREKNKFDENLREFKLDKNNEKEPFAIPEMLVRIVLEDARSFFLLRNQPEMKALSIRESITKMAKWLRAEKLAGHANTKFLGIEYKIPFYNKKGDVTIASQTRIMNIVDAFGVMLDEDGVPTVDENGDIMFNSFLDQWYANIENSMKNFADPNQFRMICECINTILNLNDNFQKYYESFNPAALKTWNYYMEQVRALVLEN